MARSGRSSRLTWQLWRARIVGCSARPPPHTHTAPAEGPAGPAPGPPARGSAGGGAGADRGSGSASGARVQVDGQQLEHHAVVAPAPRPGPARPAGGVGRSSFSSAVGRGPRGVSCRSGRAAGPLSSPPGLDRLGRRPRRGRSRGGKEREVQGRQGEGGPGAARRGRSRGGREREVQGRQGKGGPGAARRGRSRGGKERKVQGHQGATVRGANINGSSGNRERSARAWTRQKGVRGGGFLLGRYVSLLATPVQHSSK
jgi:hypothetical protein